MIFKVYRSVKPLADFFGAVLLVSALAPLILLIGLLRMATDNHGVLFSQKRVGKNGRVFTLYKFCTLVPTADGKNLTFTRFGRWLRRTSLDELPQLFNVIKGDMSLVGPRPLPMDYLQGFSKFQSARHRVRPGITGLAQVNGRDELCWDQRFILDNQYVEQRNMMLDLSILIRTLLISVKQSGANPYDNTPPVLKGMLPLTHRRIIDS